MSLLSVFSKQPFFKQIISQTCEDKTCWETILSSRIAFFFPFLFFLSLLHIPCRHLPLLLGFVDASCLGLGLDAAPPQTARQGNWQALGQQLEVSGAKKTLNQRWVRVRISHCTRDSVYVKKKKWTPEDIWPPRAQKQHRPTVLTDSVRQNAQGRRWVYNEPARSAHRRGPSTNHLSRRVTCCLPAGCDGDARDTIMNYLLVTLAASSGAGQGSFSENVCVFKSEYKLRWPEMNDVIVIWLL